MVWACSRHGLSYSQLAARPSAACCHFSKTSNSSPGGADSWSRHISEWLISCVPAWFHNPQPADAGWVTSSCFSYKQLSLTTSAGWASGSSCFCYKQLSPTRSTGWKSDMFLFLLQTVVTNNQCRLSGSSCFSYKQLSPTTSTGWASDSSCFSYNQLSPTTSAGWVSGSSCFSYNQLSPTTSAGWASDKFAHK